METLYNLEELVFPLINAILAYKLVVETATARLQCFAAELILGGWPCNSDLGEAGAELRRSLAAIDGFTPFNTIATSRA